MGGGKQIGILRKWVLFRWVLHEFKFIDNSI